MHHSAPTEWLSHQRADEQTRFPSFCSRHRLYDVQPFLGICFFNPILALTGSHFSIGRAICSIRREGTLTCENLFIGKRTMLVMGIVTMPSCTLPIVNSAHCTTLLPISIATPKMAPFLNAIWRRMCQQRGLQQLAGKAGFSLHLHRSTTVLTGRAL